MDERLRIPLSELWSEVRVPGLPVWHTSTDQAGTYLHDLHGDMHEFWAPDETPAGRYASPLHALSLDLSRPGASDILARRLAFHVWEGCGVGVMWRRHAVGVWSLYRSVEGMTTGHIGESEHRFVDDMHSSARGWMSMVPSLADLDPTDDTRLNWPGLGEPRVVDLVALGIVARHVYSQE